MTKHIFVTGGVVSSLGKGLTSASIGMLLENRGLSVRMQKLDPYINVDPGTMSPYQHGEVYVLDDGSETDLDLGHYERFTNNPLTRDCNYTTGQIYQAVIDKERQGVFLGQTVQVIPHITNEIKAAIAKLEGDDVDVVISEIGGTVGDIESQPFMEAIRQFALDIGKENCLYIHLTLIPYLKAAGEQKTKPTQHSVGQLRQIGIQPDILICRTERSLGREERAKIGLFCNVPVEAVIEERDKDFSIYEVPLSLVEHGLDGLIVRKLNLKAGEPDLDHWRDLLHRLRNPDHEISIAVVGKYAEHRDAYKSIYEALDHAGIANRSQVRIQRVHSEAVEREGPERLLSGVDGVLIPGGFGERGIEGKVDAVRFARERGIPFLGICLGMQCAVIEYARNVVDLEGANSTEFDKDNPHPVICLLDEQMTITNKGGTMRLGAQPTKLDPDGKAAACYGRLDISERHRHRYEFNNVYRQQFAAHGMQVTGTRPDGGLVEIVEIPEHPWFVAVQYHPEFKSQPTRAHPLFDGFVSAAVERHVSRQERAQPAEFSSGPDAEANAELRGRRTKAAHVDLSHIKRRRMRPMMNVPNDPPDDQSGDAPEKKIIVDEDWKTQVQAEKEEAERKREEGADAGEEEEGEAPPSAGEAEAPDAPMPPPTLEIVVTSMGMQAMMSMGLMPHPDQSEPKVYLNQAKHFIDTIAMLEEKTEGNRTDEESKLFEHLLHELRMAYVAVQKKEAGG